MSRPLRVTAPALVAVLATAALASCTGASHPTGGPSPTSIGESSGLAGTALRPHRLAVTYAGRLIAAAPHIGGEVALSSAPPRLSRPDQTIAASGLVTRASYWSVRRSPQRVYAALKKAPVDQLRLSGWGRPGAGSNAPNYADLFYTGVDVPRYLNAAELYVEILGTGPRRSAIAAFAEVVPTPVRQPAEIIPVDGTTVVVERTRAFGSHQPAIRQVTLTQPEAREFIAAFNGARVTAGACVGGIPPSFGYGVTASGQGHTWRLTWNGVGNCGALSVQRDGRPLPSIETTQAILRLLRTDVLAGDGAIDGGFWSVSGASLHPLDGTLTASTGGRPVARFTVRQQRGFEFIVPPGRYTLTGRSPDTHGGSVTCRGQRSAVVRAGHITRVDVRCRGD